MCFLGYSTGKKGWKAYDLETGAIFMSRDVQVFEQSFSFAPSSPLDSSPNISGPNPYFPL